MSLKKWLNEHNLVVSCLGFSLLVAILNLSSTGLYLSFTKSPYLAMENTVQDWVAKLGRTAPKDSRIFFLADDAPSHELDQLWPEDFEAQPILKRMKQPPPWPRDVYAAILDRLAGAGATVVGFDYMLKGETPNDPILKEALDKYASRVVIGSHIDSVLRGRAKFPQLSPPPRTIIPEAADPRVGFVNMFPDVDGVVRHFQLRTTLTEMAGIAPNPGDPVFDSLAVRILNQAGLGSLAPPSHGQYRIRYAYKGETLRQSVGRSQSVADIFIQSMWEANYQNGAFFKDKIVLVGPEGNYHKDVLASPFGIIGGPEFHLNVMNAILTNSFVHETPQWVDLLLIASGGLLAYLAGRRLRNPVFRLGLTLVIGGIFFLAAVWLFNHADLTMPVFSPVFCLVGATITAVTWQQIVERAEKAAMRKTFEKYVSRDVVKEILDNPESYLNSMVGTRKSVTVLFSDVRGFTTITESGDPQALVSQLNEYFDHMVDLVFKNDGTLDKYIGDAVMAQWGGIYSKGLQQDAINAVRAAVQMRKALVKLNEVWIPAGKLEIKIGIGINHGEAIVGNIGSEKKMEVTLIGDAVNTASRLEGITKQYHNDLIIGSSVADFVRGQFHLRTVSLNQPKGKTKPLELFTVLDDKTPETPEPAWLALHEEGVKLYRTRQFAAAVPKFDAVLKEVPDDWLAEEYRQRCERFHANPPSEDWEPVDKMETK